MENSASNDARDEIDPQTYSITFEDICHLKNKIAALEAEVRATDTSGGRSSPSVVFQIASDIKSSLEKIKTTPIAL
jgi:EAL domain-containing protein (putative c-di-GMP-specific phosphodiesterase class I)